MSNIRLMEYKLRNATRKEVDLMVKWAAKEGWNPGLHDASVFWKTDPKGFIVMINGKDIIGSGSIVSYQDKFGFMGFFIVKKKFRSKGLGTKLWFYRRDKLLTRLKKGAAIGMDGVFNMQSFYSKGGFKFSHRDLRMEGKAKKEDFSSKVSKILKKDFTAIDSFDEKHFGYERKDFLKGWLFMKDSLALKYLDNSKIKGYGVIRKCKTGYKIGPLFADKFEVALELYKGLSSHFHGKTVFLDIPEINKDAVKLSKMYKMKEMFGCARMYYGKAPNLPYHQIYGVTTFELG